MHIYFSTNAIPAENWERIHEYLDEFEGEIGLEIFPEYHKPCFEGALRKELAYLEQMPCSLHGPYYESEYAVAGDSEEFRHSVELLRKTLEEVAPLHVSYMVYHHSNMVIREEEKVQRLAYARENYETVRKICEEYGVPPVVENVTLGTLHKGLFSQEEFIAECKKLGCKVLIDIGHCNLSGWNIPELIRQLKDQIVSYHVHNNYGKLDDHLRIHDGTIDFEEFLECYKECTPNADIVVEYSPEGAADVEGVKADFRYLQKVTREITQEHKN